MAELSVENQSRNSTEMLNLEIQQIQYNRQKTNKEIHKAEGKTSKAIQKPEKDVIVSKTSSNADESAYKLQSKTGVSSKITLEAPSYGGWSLPGQSNLIGKNEPSLIVIMARALCKISQTSSNFWKLMWQESSQSMMMQVKFAPIIADATEKAAKDEADATREQAKQDLADGIINISTFVVASISAGAMEWKNPESSPANDGEKVGVKDDESEDENLKTATDNLEVQQDQNQVNDEINKSENKTSNNLKENASKSMQNGGRLQKGFFGFMGKLAGVGQSMSLLSQGTTGVVNSQYEDVQAKFQEGKGVQEALSQASQSYAQFYGQSFSRGNDLAQGASQFITNAMQLLSEASQTVTQTITSMFRG